MESGLRSGAPRPGEQSSVAAADLDAEIAVAWRELESDVLVYLIPVVPSMKSRRV